MPARVSRREARLLRRLDGLSVLRSKVRGWAVGVSSWVVGVGTVVFSAGHAIGQPMTMYVVMGGLAATSAGTALCIYRFFDAGERGRPLFGFLFTEGDARGMLAFEGIHAHHITMQRIRDACGLDAALSCRRLHDILSRSRSPLSPTVAEYLSGIGKQLRDAHARIKQSPERDEAMRRAEEMVLGVTPVRHLTEPQAAVSGQHIAWPEMDTTVQDMLMFVRGSPVLHSQPDTTREKDALRRRGDMPALADGRQRDASSDVTHNP